MANNSPKVSGHPLLPNIVTLAQHKSKLDKDNLKYKLEYQKLEHEKSQKELETKLKKSELQAQKSKKLEAEHKKVKQELHKMKLSYDGEYAFRHKEDKRQSLVKAREAKATAKKTTSELGKAKRARTGRTGRQSKSQAKQ